MKPFSCIAFVLLAAAGGLAAGELEWHPDANMDSQLFPSLLIATATQRPTDDDNEPDPAVLGDPYGAVGVAITAPAPRTKVQVTLLENAVMNKTTWDKKVAESTAWKTFVTALAVGTLNLEEHEKKFEANDQPQYQITDINQARKDGIMPISYQRAE